jgi:rhomboid protease GluP
MNSTTGTDNVEDMRRQLAVSFGAFLQLGWIPQWAGPTHLVGTSRFIRRKPVDLIVIESGWPDPALDCSLPYGKPGTAGMQQQKSDLFFPAYIGLLKAATNEQLVAWEKGLSKLESDTRIQKIKAEADEEALAAAMPYAPGGLWVTYIIVAVNVIVFILMAIAGVGVFDASGDGLLNWGADFAPYTLNGEGWRLVTGFFLHAGIIHLVLNMLTLFQVGSQLEPMLGRVRFAAVYFTAGILGSLASLWWHTNPVPSVGASGAVFGMFGCLLALLLTKALPANHTKALLVSVGVVVTLNLLNGLRAGIDNAAHMGGLVAGFICGLSLRPFLLKPRPATMTAMALLVFSALACAGYLAANRNNDRLLLDAEKKLTEYERAGLAPYGSPVEDSILLEQLVLVKPQWDGAVDVMQSAPANKLSPSFATRRTQLLRYAILRRDQNLMEQRQLRGDTTVVDSLRILGDELEKTLAALKE